MNVSRLRDFIINQNPQAVDRFKALLHKWDSLQYSVDAQQYYLFPIWNGQIVYKRKIKKIKKYFLKNPGPMQIDLTQEDLDIIFENRDLIDLIYHKFVLYEYPFHVNKGCKAFEELAVYGLTNNMSVGEVGAGTGALSILLCLTYDSLSMYINELNSRYIQRLNNYIPKIESLLYSNEVFSVAGYETDPNFPDSALDLIIVRNSFHHFSEKEKMLEAILNALKPGGRLILVESLKDLVDTNEHKCKLILDSIDIYDYCEAAGFIKYKETKQSNSGLGFFFYKREEEYAD